MVDATPISPLQNAVGFRDLPRLRRLLADGADPDTRGPLGHTPLHTAGSLGEAELARVLIESGARVDQPDDAGNTPLMVAVAAAKPSTDVVDVLLGAGANPDAPNQAGVTPRAFALARPIRALRQSFAGSGAADAPAQPAIQVADIEITASTPSRLTLTVDGGELSFFGELVVLEDGRTDRILVVDDMKHFTDGTEVPAAFVPQILCFLTARRFLYDRGEGFLRR